LSQNNLKKILQTKKLNKSSLYLVSPEQFDLKKFSKDLEKILATKTISLFQLRIKNIDKDNLIEYIEKIFPICKNNNVLFILNDNPNLVKLYDLDGVHVGEDDPSINYCRRIIGKNKIIGKSCYNSPTLAIKAQNNGADYIAFGSFFKTETKKTTKKLNFNQIKGWKNFKSIPVVGIGGINIFNYKIIAHTNMDFYAISSCVWKSKLGPDKYLKKFKNIIDNC